MVVIAMADKPIIETIIALGIIEMLFMKASLLYCLTPSTIAPSHKLSKESPIEL